MDAWIYDEDRWPSGFAGGEIPKLGPEYREKHLFMAENEIPHHPQDIEIDKVFTAKKEYYGNAKYYRAKVQYLLKDFREVPIGEEVSSSADTVVLYFYKWTAPLGNARFSGGSYFPTCSIMSTCISQVLTISTGVSMDCI